MNFHDWLALLTIGIAVFCLWRATEHEDAREEDIAWVKAQLDQHQQRLDEIKTLRRHVEDVQSDRDRLLEAKASTDKVLTNHAQQLAKQSNELLRMGMAGAGRGK